MVLDVFGFTRQMVAQQSEQILEIARSFEDQECVPMGEFSVISNGAGESSKKCTLPKAFVRLHDLEPGMKNSYWMHGPTGALIIIPKGGV